MQHPQPDQQMQQQIQYTSPQYQHLQQPVMLCPVQYVYEQLLPDEQGQPSPAQPFQSQAYLLNVPNTPPWAQNRPNVIYMQQMSNMQPFMQQMVQNPMYNYQYQPMIVQEHIRQVPSYINQSVMQNPQIVQNVQRQMMQNIAQNQQIMQTVQNQMVQNSAQAQVMQNVAQNPQLMQNVVQNQVVNQNPGMMNSNIIQNPIRFQMEKRETPILASMLNVRKPLHQNELVSILRPQYQNVRPQMIIVNPIAKHTCGHNTQKEPPPPPAIEKQLKNEIQIIRSQVPEGLSVKTIQVPVTALVKPNENLFQNIAPAGDIHPRVNNKPKQLYNRDSQTNYKRKIKELLELNNKDEVLAKRMCHVNKPDEQIFKAQVPIDTPPNTSEIQTNNSSLPIVNTQIMNVTSQVEEKKLRNTVFVQARGRVDEVRVNEVQNVNYTNVSNTGTSFANIIINTKSIENLDKSVLVNNVNFELNKTNNEHFNIEAVNNLKVMHNNIMNWNNQSVDTNIGSEININNIGNLEDVLMQIQMQTQNNVTEVNFDNQFISEQVVQNIKVTTKEEKTPSLQDIVVVKENSRQDKVKLTQAISSNNGVTTTANKNTGQNEAMLSRTISTENSSMTIKNLLSNERKTRKSKNAKVTESTETDMTQYKSTNVPQTANIEASNGSNDLQLRKNPEEDDSMNKSTITDMSIMRKIDFSSDTNQNKSDVTNVKISDEAKEIEKRRNKEIKIKSKLTRNDEVDKKNDNKLKGTKIEKSKRGKKKMVDIKVSNKEPIATYVLTHVLDGHIIQESNVPFLVQKPSILPVKGKPIVREEKEEINEKTEEDIEESIPVETKDNTVEESIPVETEENTVEESIRVETEVSSDTDTEKDLVEERNKPEYDKPDTSVADEGSPFKDLKKDIVEAWTIFDVTSHLMKHASWRDTALKLADQEIDGESLLLASKDQLIQIDICEEQAQEICDFVEQVQ